MIRHLIVMVLSILFIIPALLSQNKYRGLFSTRIDSSFKVKDFNAIDKFPRVYRQILEDDLGALKNTSKKDANKTFRLNGELYSPLIFACKHARIEAVYILIKKGALIDFRNNFNESALSYLCNAGINDTVLAKKLLFSTVFTEDDKNGYTPLMYAMLSRSNTLFDFALAEYSKILNPYNSDEIKECFIYSGENIHAIEKTCKLFDLNKPFFIDKNRIFFERYMPIKAAIERTNMYNGLRRLYGQESERPKDDSLDIKIFKLLIENGMDLNVKFEKGRSILFEVHENKPLVKFLCDKLEDLNLVDSNSQTFLQFYIESCVIPPTMMLNGHEVNIYDLDRDYSKEFDAINFLISKGAITNDKTTNGNGLAYLLIYALNKKNKFIITQFFKKYEKTLFDGDLWTLIKAGTSPAQFDQLKNLFESSK